MKSILSECLRRLNGKELFRVSLSNLEPGDIFTLYDDYNNKKGGFTGIVTSKDKLIYLEWNPSERRYFVTSQLIIASVLKEGSKFNIFRPKSPNLADKIAGVAMSSLSLSGYQIAPSKTSRPFGSPAVPKLSKMPTNLLPTQFVMWVIQLSLNQLGAGLRISDSLDPSNIKNNILPILGTYHTKLGVKSAEILCPDIRKIKFSEVTTIYFLNKILKASDFFNKGVPDNLFWEMYNNALRYLEAAGNGTLVATGSAGNGALAAAGNVGNGALAAASSTGNGALVATARALNSALATAGSIGNGSTIAASRALNSALAAAGSIGNGSTIAASRTLNSALATAGSIGNGSIVAANSAMNSTLVASSFAGNAAFAAAGSISSGSIITANSALNSALAAASNVGNGAMTAITEAMKIAARAFGNNNDRSMTNQTSIDSESNAIIAVGKTPDNNRAIVVIDEARAVLTAADSTNNIQATVIEPTGEPTTHIFSGALAASAFVGNSVLGTFSKVFSPKGSNIKN
ncbi:MAG: hypothetical protein E6Q66_04790 [Pedobacter sp.]|nr:MAG: hypothetical protein E6Q66_04790 [Pedobacter sp.]